MSKERTGIGPWLYLSLLILPTAGFGLINLPYYSAKIMGSNGYLAYPIAALIVLPGIAAIYLLAKRFPGQSIIQQGKTIFGPVFGLICGLLYLFSALCLLTTFTRDITNMVNTYYLEQTPGYVIMLVFLLIAAYLATRGIETISRLACFILIPGFLVLGFLIACGYLNVKWTQLLPVTSIHPLLYFKGGLTATYCYYLMGLSAMILPFLKPLKTFPRLAGGSLAFLALFYTLLAVGVFGVYGAKHILRFAWPSLELFRIINFPFLLLEQAGMLMLIDWITLVLLGTAYLYYTVALGFSQNLEVLDYKRWVWILFPVKFVMVIWPRNITETKYFMGLIIMYGWIIFFAYPIILWLFAVLARRKGQVGDAQ